LEAVEINGTKQWINIRGQDPDAPLLLYLAGGPAGSEMPWVRHYQPGLERHFIVVHWDQPGAAKSFDAVTDWPSLRVERFVEDAGTLIDLLLKRYNRKKLIVLGNSWGSIIGVMVAQRWPEKLHAYVGATQQVDTRKTDRRGWELTLQKAIEAENPKDVATLEKMGPPPYPREDFVAHYWTLIRLQAKYGGTPESRKASAGQLQVFLSAPEYTMPDRINFYRGLYLGWKYVYPQLSDLNFERDVRRLNVPVYLLLGAHDLTVPPEFAQRWFTRLQAPHKELIWFEDSGHSLVVDSGGQLERVLVERVLRRVKE
jgi:pimeloyl-ACP methyl ester carboxylesterase